MTTTLIHRSALLLTLSATIPGVLADDTSARSLAATCTGCHGTNGISAGPIPSIGGMEKERMVSLMKEFKDGKRPATVMQQHAKGYTDEQIELIAGWFAAQKR